MSRNYKQIKAIEYQNKKKLLLVNPTLNESSGIYFLTRVDEEGIRFAYIGQARRVISRLAQHMMGYEQHIDRSLKAHGLYSKDNPYGWKVGFLSFSEDKLDEMENKYILEYARTHQLLNRTSGRQGQGKRQIAEYKPPKTYRDGLKQGEKNLAKKLANIIDKHLVVELKDEKKNNKVSIKAKETFMELIYGTGDKEDKTTT